MDLETTGLQQKNSIKKIVCYNARAKMKKLENNWRQKSLENLEKDIWDKPTYDSHLVRRTFEIRKIPLTDLTNDDIAMMLRQQFSLEYIVPLAIDKLQECISNDNADSEDEIMEAVLKIPSSFWRVTSRPQPVGMEI
jgi:hypothetical protein